MGASEPSDGVLLRAIRGEPVAHPPVWFMRQAGRSLPEYRRVREGIGMLDACSRPDLITEITLQPLRRHGVDAAIFFSDIVLPLKAVGVDLDIVAGTGPVVAEPVRTLAQARAIRPLEAGAVDFVAEATAMLVAELGGTPLIGFAGAPYTLASYLIEGGPSKDHAATKALMLGAPDVWDTLMSTLAQISAEFLRVQAAAGASAVQLFDSWAGGLAPEDYRAHVLGYSARVFDAIADLGVPRTHFGVGTGEILADMAGAGCEVVGVDWRVPLDAAAARIRPDQAVQGNLDPTLVFAPWEVLSARALDVVERGRRAGRHVFNLGHGVLPGTDPTVLTRLVELVQGADA